jgi:hypothetical protein
MEMEDCEGHYVSWKLSHCGGGGDKLRTKAWGEREKRQSEIDEILCVPRMFNR